MQKPLLTKEEKQEILESVYQLHEGAEVTPEDIQWAKERFKTPEDLKQLRKMFRILTNAERGIAYIDDEDISSVSEQDLKKFAIEVKINHLASEKIRQALIQFYTLIQGSFMEDKSKEIEASEAQKIKDNEAAEELEKDRIESKKIFGENI